MRNVLKLLVVAAIILCTQAVWVQGQYPSGTTSNTPQYPTTGKNLTFTVNGVSFEMIFVKSGMFLMGCTGEQSNCSSDEKPSHSVSLSSYYIGKFTVTQKLWRAVMGTTIRQQRNLANSNSLYGEGDDYPMYYINYIECEEFCANLNKLLSSQLPEGYKFCLPTEAQWEYAARGGKNSKGYKYSGSDYINDVAWYDGNSGEKTHEVGMKNKNELGIFDMSGNVWEWCHDWKGDYSISSKSNPKGSSYSSYRVLRGGSWRLNARLCCVYSRAGDIPGFRSYACGFRLALVL